jgi:hypothetical protein
MKLTLTLCLSLFFMTSSFAEYAKVVVIKGKSVTYESLSLTKGQMISTGGILKTGKRSFVKLELLESGGLVSVGPRSQVEVKAIEKSGPKVITLLKGALRYKGSDSKESKEAKRPTLYTKNASMGVRGTDFLMKANPVLGESEIVLFTGLVQMTNRSDAANTESIGPGQWGGIGGRFGAKVQKPIQLPKKALNGFNKLLNW